MVIYYSPDAGVMSSNSKYNSETELQKFSSPTASSQHHRSVHNNDFGYEPREKLLKRPMPFSKALEISNNMESNLFADQGRATLTTRDTDNRQSQYEMNYEISV